MHLRITRAPLEDRQAVAFTVIFDEYDLVTKSGLGPPDLSRETVSCALRHLATIAAQIEKEQQFLVEE